MARKMEVLTISSDNKDNRDNGKQFLIIEPSAIEGEQLFMRLSAVCGGEITLGGLLSVMADDKAKDIWDSLLNMAEFLPTGEGGLKRKIEKEDIEEVSTIITLKKGALNMILGFPVTYSPSDTDDKESMQTA